MKQGSFAEAMGAHEAKRKKRTEKDLQRDLERATSTLSSQTGFPWHFTPVENILGKGTFDVWLAVGGRSAWVELKMGGPNTKPDMRPGQLAFGMGVMGAGIPAWVLVGQQDGSCRLIHGGTDGENWRDLLHSRWAEVGPEVVKAILRIDS